jgi:hypothetical protein
MASVCILLLAGGLFAETKEVAPFKIHTPRTTGLGNAYISMPGGCESLWTNPAGFSTQKTELTILGLNVSALGNMKTILDLADTDTASTKSIFDSIEPAVTGNGIGTNVGLGVSWVGNRIGLGLYDSLDMYLQGEPFPAGVEGYVDNTISLIGGYAHPFSLSDTIVVSAGLTLRPSLKYRVEVDGTMIEDLIADNSDPMAYFQSRMKNPLFGVPVDVGTRATFPFGLSAAFTIRDIFADYNSDGAAYEYYTNWSVHAGGAWNPDMKDIKWLIDPTFSLEISNLNRIFEKETGFWKELHLGVEIAAFKNILTVWAGLDGGYPALGTSIDLFIMDLAIAYGTTEYGRYLGDRPVSNLTVEVSFRLD